MNRLTRSFSFAWQGLKYCFSREPNFRIHVFISGITVLMAIFFQVSGIEWMVIALCTAMVLSLEMINTAIEKICNIVHKEQHPGIKMIKDLAAGAVLLGAFLAAVCGTIIFLPRIITYLKSITGS
jgi:diacylglycerol kinase